MPIASGERGHYVTLHAPAGTRGDGTPMDLATDLPAKLEAIPLAFQLQERQASGGLTRQTLYRVVMGYRDDVDSDLVLLEQCHSQLALQILIIRPSDMHDELELTCVVGKQPLVEEVPPVEPPPSPLLEDLVSYWAFDAGWNDVHGSNHLTNSTGVTAVPGKLGNAADFEKDSAQYLSHPDPNPLGDEDWTYTLWIKRETIGVTQQLLSKDHNIARYYEINITSDIYSLSYHVGGVGVGDVFALADTDWHFLAIWHDATAHTVNLQSDNRTVTSASDGTYALPAVSIPVRIGARQYPGFEQYFDGLIDDVGLWRRVLTADERTQLYNSGNGLAYPFSDG